LKERNSLRFEKLKVYSKAFSYLRVTTCVFVCSRLKGSDFTVPCLGFMDASPLSPEEVVYLSEGRCSVLSSSNDVVPLGAESHVVCGEVKLTGLLVGETKSGDNWV